MYGDNKEQLMQKSDFVHSSALTLEVSSSASRERAILSAEQVL